MLAALPLVLVAVAVGLKTSRKNFGGQFNASGPRHPKELGQTQEALNYLNQIVAYQPDHADVLAHAVIDSSAPIVVNLDQALPGHYRGHSIPA